MTHSNPSLSASLAPHGRVAPRTTWLVEPDPVAPLALISLSPMSPLFPQPNSPCRRPPPTKSGQISMAAAAHAPALMEDLVEEILLRLPPSEPASLFRAALACKPWCRLISGARFRRRFREFHRTPPMLGFICNRVEDVDDYCGYLARFVPTCSFRPPRPHAADCRSWRAVDARHGRVLLHSTSVLEPLSIVVWDPITDERRQLSSTPQDLFDWTWNAAVLCAAGGACDHLDCHDGPFLIVLLDSGLDHMTLRVYSSEIGDWDETTYITQFPRVMTMEDGGLGVVRMEGRRFSLWSMKESPDGCTGWSQVRVIDLEKLLSVDEPSIFSCHVGFAHGVGVIFMATYDGLFSYDLKSGWVRKVYEGGYNYNVLPYMTFYTPAFGAVSTGE